MIPVNKIAASLSITHPTQGGTYITSNDFSDIEYSWWKDGKRSPNFPHFSVVRKASGNKNDKGTFGSVKFDGNSAVMRAVPGGLDGSPAQGAERKIWVLRKFHISVPLGGGAVNGHIFYRISSAQHVEYSGSNLDLLRDAYFNTFKGELARRTAVWDSLAAAFYSAAVGGIIRRLELRDRVRYRSAPRRPPVSTTKAGFNHRSPYRGSTQCSDSG